MKSIKKHFTFVDFKTTVGLSVCVCFMLREWRWTSMFGLNSHMMSAHAQMRTLQSTWTPFGCLAS